MRSNVTTLGWTHIIVSGLHLLGGMVALIVLALFGGAAAIAGQESQTALPIMLIIGLVAFGIAAVLALPGFLVGWGLITMQPWARAGGIVLSILEITAAPFGTILGIWGLIVLLDSNTSALFSRHNSFGP